MTVGRVGFDRWDVVLYEILNLVQDDGQGAGGRGQEGGEQVGLNDSSIPFNDSTLTSILSPGRGGGAAGA